MSHRTNLATHIENALRQVLEHDANTLARETGFVQRQRKLTGSTLEEVFLRLTEESEQATPVEEPV